MSLRFRDTFAPLVQRLRTLADMQNAHTEQSSLVQLAADHHLRPFLPVVYVAWADGELTDAELDHIGDLAQTTEGLDDGAKGVLASFLDPDRPPTPSQLHEVLALLRQTASKLERSEIEDLVAFGRGVADADGCPEPAERALREIEASLGAAVPELLREVAGPVLEQPSQRFTPSADHASLAALLSQPHADVRNEVRDLISHFEHVYDTPKDEYREIVLDWLQQVADRGFGRKAYPPLGDVDDLGEFITVFETLAEHDLSLLVKFGVQFGLFGGAIYNLGTDKHHELLADIASVETPGCFAMTELGHGSNVRDIETTATWVPEREAFVIHTPRELARKEWIGNAAVHGKLAVVFAQLHTRGEEHGVHAFIVPIRDDTGATMPGVRIGDCGDKMGLQGVDNGQLWFDQVEVPRDALLDRFGQVDAEGNYHSSIPSAGKRFFTMLGTLVGGRVSIACAAVTVSKMSLAVAIKYAMRRRQFGPAGEGEVSLMRYRTHQKRLLTKLATTYALHFATRELAEQFVTADHDGDTREIEARAAGLKAYASWHATATVQDSRECCGGEGYRAVNRFAALKADSDIFTTFEGDNTVLMQLVAKSLLTNYKRQFSNMTWLTAVKWVSEQASTALVELNPVVVRMTSDDHLRDHEFQIQALKYRRDHLLTSVARRLKKRIDAGMDSFDAFIECQIHLMDLANAHVELELAQAFHSANKSAEDEARPPLAKLMDVYCLDALQRDGAWYIEQGYLDGSKYKAIRKLKQKLLTELAHDAEVLVDAFAIPDALLAAPIAGVGIPEKSAE